MGFKKYENTLGFAEMSLMGSLSKARSYHLLSDISSALNWSELENVLISHYPVGKRLEGADAYPPLVLLKGLLLQKWFNIKSDPELESQINDRLSFKVFMGLPFEVESPDHSTFSRFRSRISESGLRDINNHILEMLRSNGLEISEGVAVDARLIESASKPLSNDKLKELKEKAKLEDESGKSVKFRRDLESDWSKKNKEPHFGIKEHTAVDAKNGLVLSTRITESSCHDYNFLPLSTMLIGLKDYSVKGVYADKGYCGKSNSKFLYDRGISDLIMRKDGKNYKLTENEKFRNKLISKFRYIVEQYFGITELRYGAGRARFPRLWKNNIDALYRQLSFNIFRGTKILATA